MLGQGWSGRVLDLDGQQQEQQTGMRAGEKQLSTERGFPLSRAVLVLTAWAVPVVQETISTWVGGQKEGQGSLPGSSHALSA